MKRDGIRILAWTIIALGGIVILCIPVAWLQANGLEGSLLGLGLIMAAFGVLLLACRKPAAKEDR
jgi:hypothetical protein